MKNNYIISILLITLSILLTILVPGGPVETRDFSHYSVEILSLFNIFLTSLGIVSFVVAFLVIKKKSYSLLMSKIIALLYILVYFLDLFKIFPTSKTDMPIALFIIEIVSILLATVLFYFCSKKNAIKSKNKESLTFKFSVYKLLIVFFILLFATAIIIFATNAAMGQG